MQELVNKIDDILDKIEDDPNISEDIIETLYYVRDDLIPQCDNLEREQIKTQLAAVEGSILLMIDEDEQKLKEDRGW